jgi:hypothetical protein
MPPFQITIRQLMIGIAIVGIALALGLWYRRWFIPWWEYQQSIKTLTG